MFTFVSDGSGASVRGVVWAGGVSGRRLLSGGRVLVGGGMVLV
jgi:hypothetical protein